MGIATLVNGTAIVNNTLVTETSRIFLSNNKPGGTPGALYVSSRIPGSNFVITSSNNADTSAVAWEIKEPA